MSFSFHINAAPSNPNLPATEVISKIKRGGRVPETGDGAMDIHCNAGVTSTNLVGDLAGYGVVWYHPNGIANILSLSRVKNSGFRITYDSDKGNEFLVVHKPNGVQRVFTESNHGLFYMDTKSTGVVLVNTVEDNKSKFSACDYSRAVVSRRVQKTICHPSTRD
eukprot:scaffold26100_cov31-Attheya_sp.AAC.5